MIGNDMEIIKRDGRHEKVLFDKISNRVKRIGKERNVQNVNYTELVIKVIEQLYDGIPTSQIDELTAQQCASLNTTHLDYGKLAAGILVSNHHKNTPSTFSDAIKLLWECYDKNNNHSPVITREIYNLSQDYSDFINDLINYERDYLFDYFGFKTLERAYLLKNNGKIIERPQTMWMRVALTLHNNDFDKVKETYNLLSTLSFIHATPTLFNAGTPKSQLSSCYLIAMEDDSIKGIFNTLGDCAAISKLAGGIGMHIHNIRAKGSAIRGTNGVSNGIVPMLRVFNNTARYVDQGGGRRNGSFAIYIEPWHADIQEFLEMRKNHGDEEARARDLFYALWIPDLFMKRVKNNQKWSLFCPDTCRVLYNSYGDEFNEKYEQFEKDSKFIKQINARDLWFQILDSQIETGTPYLLYKDACNKKSNQQNLGVIKSSNLCCVRGDTLLLTDKGHIPIETLKDENVNVWNGKEFNEVIVKQTNDNAELLNVEFSDGSELTCTKYHKFYIQTKFPTSKMKQDVIKSQSVQIVEAKDLTSDMKLIKCEYPIINNKEELKSAYTNGIFCADGTYTNNSREEERCNFKALEDKSYCKRHIEYQKNDDISEYCCGTSYIKKTHISLYGEKIKLLEYLDYRSVGEEKNNKLNVTLSVDLEDKFFVPINYSLQSKLDWFAGYCDGDGSIANNNTNQSLQISCIHKDFLLKIKLMLQTCGIASKVTLNMEERLSYLPNGKGDMDYFASKKLWRILIGSNDLQKLVELGFKPKRLIINKRIPQRNAVQFVKITKIIDKGETDKTFCFNESKRHAGIFNGVITSQCEIIEYSDNTETAVCNLASINLSKFVNDDKTYNYDELYKITKVVARNLDKVIDINYYPTNKTRNSNLKHRPIGIGVQGLADVFAKMKIPFHSLEAKVINKDIFETIYYAAIETSCDLAKELKPYSTYFDSPISHGKFQFDLWDDDIKHSGKWDWDKLRKEVLNNGIRNSLSLAPMPTASTSQILGNNEAFEPFTSNIYVRRTIAGEFVLVNKYLQKDLIDIGKWNDETKNSIIANKGSVQQLDISDEMKLLYKTVWEIPMKHIIDMAADRGHYICQSQSMNLWMEQPDYKKLTAMHFYGWEKGLKTGIYYLRTKAKAAPQQFTIVPENNRVDTDDDEPCEMCSG